MHTSLVGMGSGFLQVSSGRMAAASHSGEPYMCICNYRVC